MKTTYYISLNMNTPKGPETFGQFFLGNDREAARDLFDQLRGDGDISAKTMLLMDFIEEINGIPLIIEILHCTLDDLAWNSRLITKETFRRLHLNAN